MTTTDGARPPVTVSEVLLRYLGAQVAQIRRQDLPVRLDAPGAVHDMRVAGRRLRSTLVTFEPLIEPSPAQRIRRDLRWLGRLLGAARDAEVRRERLTAAVAAEPPGVVATEEVVREVRELLDRACRDARRPVEAALDGERYRGLLTSLDALLQQPLRADSTGCGTGVLPGLVEQSFWDLDLAMRATRHTTGPSQRERRLHDARKAAKRARYAGEAMVPVAGDEARVFAGVMAAMQEALGEHLESLDAGRRLQDLARVATGPGTAFTLGRLHELERRRTASSAEQVEAAWAEATRKRVRRWLG